MIHIFKRKLFIGLGFLCLFLGLVGAFLPIMPTVPFALMAAFFFSRSSEHLHGWLLRQPYLGPAILDWEKNRMIRPRIKALATCGILSGLVYPLGFAPIPVWAKVAFFLTALSILIYILTRPSHPKAQSPRPPLQ